MSVGADPLAAGEGALARAGRREHAPPWLAAAAVLVLSAVIAAALSGALNGGGGATATGAPTPAPREIAAVPAAEAGAFAILRRPRTALDRFREIRAGAGPLGANPMLARRALAPRAPGGIVPRLVSVVPAAGALCLRILVAAGAAQWWCQPLARALRGRLMVAMIAAGRRPRAASRQFLIGLVPDGVRSVTIFGRGGAGHKVAVRGNVYARALYAPERIALRLPGRGLVSYRVRD